MHSVIHTPGFVSDASDAGMTEDEVDAVVALVASNPLAGDAIPGSGGCRKVRTAGKGKGKRGGYRTVFLYSGEDIPVFLLAVFGKGQRADLSRKEVNELAKMTKKIVDTFKEDDAAPGTSRKGKR